MNVAGDAQDYDAIRVEIKPNNTLNTAIATGHFERECIGTDLGNRGLRTLGKPPPIPRNE